MSDPIMTQQQGSGGRKLELRTISLADANGFVATTPAKTRRSEAVKNYIPAIALTIFLLLIISFWWLQCKKICDSLGGVLVRGSTGPICIQELKP